MKTAIITGLSFRYNPLMTKNITCPACANKKWKLFFQTPDYRLLECIQCTLIRTEVINNKFSRIPTKQQQIEAEKHFVNLRKNFSSYSSSLLDFVGSATRSRSLLDVGCGFGWLVLEAKKRGFSQVVGIDQSKPFVEMGKKKLKLDLRVTSLEKFKTREKFEVITLNHVMEHISDPKEFLAKTKDLLTKGGLLVVASPNIDSLMFKLFKTRWYGLQPGEHQWQFTPRSLSTLLESNGFRTQGVKVVSLDYDPSGWKKYIFKLLVSLANILGQGDQVYVKAEKI